MKNQDRVRELLLEQLTGRNAHVDFSGATKGLQLKDVGIRPKGLPHSIWELVEHIRISQYDIVDFSRNPDYESMAWPDGYWPESPKPESQQQWEDALQAVKNDREDMAKLIKNPDNDLLEPIPHGDGQTLFREAMLIVDHISYHIGQIVQVRRLLGVWKS